MIKMTAAQPGSLVSKSLKKMVRWIHYLTSTLARREFPTIMVELTISAPIEAHP